MNKTRFTHRIILLKKQNSILISAIKPELFENFENVSVEIVQCPDLTQPPFNLTSEGKHKILTHLLIYIIPILCVLSMEFNV